MKQIYAERHTSQTNTREYDEQQEAMLDAQLQLAEERRQACSESVTELLADIDQQLGEVALTN